MPTIKIDPITGAPIIVPDGTDTVSSDFVAPETSGPTESVPELEKESDVPPVVTAEVVPIEEAPEPVSKVETVVAPAVTKSPTERQLEEISNVLRNSGADTMSQQKCMAEIKRILNS